MAALAPPVILSTDFTFIRDFNIVIIIVIVLLQLAANHVTVLRSTLADFYEELDRKLASSGRQSSRRPKSANKGRSLHHC